MKVVQGVRHLSAPFPSSVLTIGNFDGVHLGHRALIQRVVERAQEKRVPAIVMTFEPHPVKVLAPDRGLHRIFDFADQQEQLSSLGVDYLIVEPFSREFSQLPPDRYLVEWIYRPFVPETVVVGYDFSFGANRQGSIDFLKDRASELGFRVEVVPPFKVSADGQVLVSSSRIRQALEAGNVELANQLLGRCFYLKGLVERGAGRGKQIGIPTANLRTTAETLPPRGVYAAWATIRGVRKKSVVNIGLNPTFTESTHQTLSVEAHLMEWEGGPSDHLYGEELVLEFVTRLRDEKKFPSATALVEQIRADIKRGAELLNGR